MTALEKLKKYNPSGLSPVSTGAAAAAGSWNGSGGTSAMERLRTLGTKASVRSFDTIKAEYEAAQRAEQSALNAANQYITDNMGWLDMKDPAELQALNDAAAAATKKREELEKEYYSHSDSYEDKMGELGKFGKAAVTVISKPFLSVDVMAETARNAADENEIDMESVPMLKYGQMTRAREDALEGTSGVGRFLAETGLSIADSAYSRMIGLGTPIGSGLASGVSAAADKTYSAGQSGDSAGRALARGITSGAISGAAEALSVGNLAKLLKKDGAKTILGTMFKQAGFEVSEEAVDYAANWVADKAFKDPNAKFSFGEMLDSALAGGLSGLFFGGLGIAGARLNRGSGFIPGSGLDGTPAAQDGTPPFAERPTTQTTPSTATQTAPAPGVDTSGQFGAVEGEKNAPANAETEQIVSDSNIQRFRTVIDGVFTGANPSGSDIVVGDTPSILQQYGAPDLQLRVSQSTVRKIVYPEGYMGGKHNLGMSAMKQLPYQIADPVAILKSKSQTNSLVLLTEWKTQDGQDVIVPIHLNKQGAVEIGNAIASAYGTSHIETILGENDSNVLYTKNNEDIHQLLSNGLQLPEAMADDVLAKNTIPQNEAGVKNQYTQESAQVFSPGSGMENATVEDGVPAQSDNGSTDEGYWDSIMEEQALPFAESDVDGYMEALLADVDQRLNRATPKDTPVTEEYEPTKKGKRAERADKSPTEHERVKEIVLDPEVTGSKSITPEFAQALSSSGISYNKDLARNLDAAGAGSAKLREGLRNLIERPFRAAGKNFAEKTTAALNDLKKVMDELGIKKGSKESAAVQRYGEGQYQDEKGEVHEYTEAMLREEFPESWQNIVKAAQYCRQLYDGYVDRINATLEQIYPNALGKAMEEEEYQNSEAGLFSWMAEEQQHTYNSLQERLNERKRQLEKAREGTQRYADLQDTIHRIEQQMENVQGKISSLRNQVDVSNAKAAAIHARIVSGEVLRNKQLQKRSDYFHHFNEMAEGWAGLVNILTTPTDIDSKLAGTSDHTKPKTRWAGFMQGRKGGKYTEDAVGGLLKYIPQAEYKISFDPIIAENRNIVKTLAQETEDSRNANKFIEWMTDWTNDLAGKTNPFDRAVQKVVGRKAISVAKWLSSRAKANAVVGNVRSATAQVFNLPNAMVYIKSPEAWKNGAAIYGRALGGDETAKSLYAESGFLNERYMDDAISQFDEGLLKKPEKFANWMLTVGDKEVAKLIWASAYEQGRAQGIADPVEYADDITRRSIAGRGVGDVPLMQKAVVTQLFAPFQVEVNNTWQLMKEAGADRNWLGLLAMFAVNFLMNTVTRELFGYDVGIDPINAVIESAGNWDEDKTAVGNVLDMGGRLGGELLSNVPYGAQIGSTLISDEYTREKIFGDADPSRFGTGNIGIDALVDTGASVLDAFSEGDITKVDIMTPLTNFLLPYGGKQVGRIIEGAQDMGMLPVISKEGMSFQPDAGSMSDTGRLRFAIDENNPADVAKLFAFGPFSTKGGMEYIEDGMLPLSEKRTAEAMAAAERGVDLVDYMDAYRAQAKVKTTADKLEAAAKFADDEETARELFGIVLGTEMVTEAGNPTQYAKVLAAMDEGMTAAEYVKYRQATYDVSKKADKLKALQAAGFTAAEAARLLEQLG